MNRNVLLAKELFIKAAIVGGMDEQTALADLESAMGKKSVGALFASFFAEQGINHELPSIRGNQADVSAAIQIQYVAIRDMVVALMSLEERSDKTAPDGLIALAAAVNSFVSYINEPKRIPKEMQAIAKNPRNRHPQEDKIRRLSKGILKDNPRLSMTKLKVELLKVDPSIDVTPQTLGRWLKE